MNIPFWHNLNTTAGGKNYGRVMEYQTVAATYDLNKVLNGWWNANAVFGADDAAKFNTFGVPVSFLALPRVLYVTSITLSAWYSADVGAQIDFGLYSISNNSFQIIYPCLATGTSSGGIARIGMQWENGFRVKWTTDLIPAFRATKQTVTDGAVNIAGDIAVITESN